MVIARSATTVAIASTDRSTPGAGRTTVPPLISGAKISHAAASKAMRDAYVFLRRLENRVQMLRDEQAHALPIDALARERIAVALGFADVAALDDALSAHRTRVADAFGATLEPHRDAPRAASDGDALRLWAAAASGAGAPVAGWSSLTPTVSSVDRTALSVDEDGA